MAQRLQIGPGKYVVVDRTFGGGEVRGKHVMGPGGTVIQLSPDVLAAPFVAMKDGGFYLMTEKFEPVADTAMVAHLPHTDPKTGLAVPGSYRDKAEQWIDAQAKKAKPLKGVSEKRANAEVKKRDGKKDARRLRPVVIKDEKTLAQAAGGLVTIKDD